MKIEHEKVVEITAQDLKSKMRSKEDIYRWFTEYLQLVLPPYNEVKTRKLFYLRLPQATPLRSKGSIQVQWNKVASRSNVPRTFCKVTFHSGNFPLAKVKNDERISRYLPDYDDN